MPQRTRVGDQWQECQRCGILTPLSQIVYQNGSYICQRAGCLDSGEKEQRDQLLAEELARDTDEGMDRRVDLQMLAGGDE